MRQRPQAVSEMTACLTLIKPHTDLSSPTDKRAAEEDWNSSAYKYVAI